jgi:lipid-A-disaccharide synthase
VADTMTVKNMQSELRNIIENEAYKNEMLSGYEYVAERLGPAGAPRHAAREMLRLLKK